VPENISVLLESTGTEILCRAVVSSLVQVTQQIAEGFCCRMSEVHSCELINVPEDSTGIAYKLVMPRPQFDRLMAEASVEKPNFRSDDSQHNRIKKLVDWVFQEAKSRGWGTIEEVQAPEPGESPEPGLQPMSVLPLSTEPSSAESSPPVVYTVKPAKPQ
jgi:hypothetical protein